MSSATDISARAIQQRRLVEAIRYQLGEHCAHLDDPEVFEVMLNDDSTVWVDRVGAGMVCVGRMDPIAAHSFIATVASLLNVTVTQDEPILSAELPIRGARLEASIKPISSSPVFNIRLRAIAVFTTADYVAQAIMTQRQSDRIDRAVKTRENIVVSGGTSTGKTTLLNAIGERIAVITPDHRVVVLEDMVELQCKYRNFIAMRASHNIDMRRLLKSTMRRRPDRIIVGEVRDGAALDMTKAYNTGHPGGLCSVHANSALAALKRIERLIAEATLAPMQEDVAEAFNLIIPIAKVLDATGQQVRRVMPFVEVHGFEGGRYLTTELEA